MICYHCGCNLTAHDFCTNCGARLIQDQYRKNKKSIAVPIFITMEDSNVLDGDGFFVQEYTLHILPAIYPDETLSTIAAKKDMKIFFEFTEQIWKFCV